MTVKDAARSAKEDEETDLTAWHGEAVEVGYLGSRAERVTDGHASMEVAMNGEEGWGTAGMVDSCQDGRSAASAVGEACIVWTAAHSDPSRCTASRRRYEAQRQYYTLQPWSWIPSEDSFPRFAPSSFSSVSSSSAAECHR